MNPFHLRLVYDDQSFRGAYDGHHTWPNPTVVAAPDRTCWWSRALVNMTPMIKHPIKVFVHNKGHELDHEGMAPEPWLIATTTDALWWRTLTWIGKRGGAGQQQKPYGGKCCKHPATL